MSNLRELALARVAAGGLPTFPGQTSVEKLQAARHEARARLLKYVPVLKLDIAEARDVMSQVDVWSTRNEEALSKAMVSPDTKLAPWLRLNMGSAELVQDWVVANYALATVGLGPWSSGKVDMLVADPGSDISPTWALTDFESRMQSFAMIVKMDDDGSLAYIFQGKGAPELSGLGGMGAVPAVIVWGIVVAVVALAAVVLAYKFLATRLELNNAVMRDLCEKAQVQGDKKTVEACVEAARDIQLSDPFKNLSSELGKAVLVIGGGYVAFRYLIPGLYDWWTSRRKK